MKKEKKTIIISCIILFVIFVLGILSLSLSGVKKIPEDTVGNTAGNLNNGGLFCEYDQKVYFSNAYDNGTLYVMNSDESDITKLSDAMVSYINASDTYLVYYQKGVHSKDGLSTLVQNYGIYRTNLKGKNADCLDDSVCTSLVLAGNHIYYQHYDKKNYTTLYKADLGGKKRWEVADSIINPHCVLNNTIYFNGTEKNHYLYGLSLSDDSIQTIWPGNVWNPVVLGSYVYYMDLSNHYALSRYCFSTNEVEILTRDRVDFFNVYDNMIYYQSAGSSNDALKRMKIDGSDNEIVKEGNYEHISMTSKYVYFNEYNHETPVYHTPLYGGDVTVFQP